MEEEELCNIESTSLSSGVDLFVVGVFRAPDLPLLKAGDCFPTAPPPQEVFRLALLLCLLLLEALREEIFRRLDRTFLSVGGEQEEDEISDIIWNITEKVL